MIVNEKTPLSRAMYWELKRHSPEGIPVYQQQIWEPDVWQILDGDKDDFLIYDRCNRLAFHIQLPYSFLHLPYVEAAVRYTYHKDHCGNCSWYYSNSSQEGNNTASTDGMTTEATKVMEKSIPRHKHEEERHVTPVTQHLGHHHSHHGEQSLTSKEHSFHHAQSHSQTHQGGTSQ